MVLFHSVWVRLNLDNSEKYSGMDEATSEDLAFPSRARGLCEHDIIHRVALRMSGGFPGVRFDEHAEFRRTEKVDEGMA